MYKGLNMYISIYVNVHSYLYSQVTLQTSAGTQCTGGFRLVGGKCMLLLLNERKTWGDSRIHCQQIGADLATFQDAGTFAAILDYVKEISKWMSLIS